ncbi:MAG: DUF433 domain-containing protein [Candidatus Margulisbacteria bacterium]|nr:DUF433 domain-containing protein [Candidatus Margulisiibacteriota bacterium]
MVEIAPGITVDEKIRFGKPVVKGTRVPINLILVKLSLGMTCKEISDEYGITEMDINAVLNYAAKVLSEEEIMVKA